MTIIEKAAATEGLLFVVFAIGLGVSGDTYAERTAYAFAMALLADIAAGVLTILWGIWA